MENLQKLTCKIQKFYSLVETHESEFQNFIKEAKKPVHSITTQSVFFRAVAPENSVANTPFEYIEGFKDDLTENIFTSLQEEYTRLEDIRVKINSANEKLQEEQIFLENLFTDFRSRSSFDLSNLNPCCPSLEYIIEWSYDIWCYYHLFHLQISQALLNLRYEDESTIKALVESFKEDFELKKKINKIRNFKFSHFEFII